MQQLLAQVPQQIINGLTLGSVYALIALGYSMVYGILQLLNFAHGDVYMVGAFIGFGVLSALLPASTPLLPTALIILLMLTVAVLGCGFLGVATGGWARGGEAGGMVGVDVGRVIVLPFFIGSALAGASGVLTGLVFTRVWHTMGFTAGLKGFTAAVIGGIGNIPGAMLGGILICLVEAFAAGFISSSFTDLFLFAVHIHSFLIAPRR